MPQVEDKIPTSLKELLDGTLAPIPESQTVVELPDEFARVDHPVKRQVLLALCESPIIGQACKSSGISRATLYSWRKSDSDFDAAFLIARQMGMGIAEEVAWHRALYGVETPIYHDGIRVGTKFVPSDTLAVFLLKGEMPEKYRERTEISGPNGGPLEIVAARLADLPSDQLKARVKELAAENER